MKWQFMERPGYLGKYREEKYRLWDEQYGKGKWRLVWVWGSRSLNFLGACGLYEDAYVSFFEHNHNILQELVSVAADVYDDSPSNIHSKCDYNIQETNRTHIQDIAIRRALKRLGVIFNGSNLIQIRHDKGIHPLSMTLSPGKVPFHKKRLIKLPWLEGWWDSGTVECFYQSNRVLEIFK